MNARSNRASAAALAMVLLTALVSNAAHAQGDRPRSPLRPAVQPNAGEEDADLPPRDEDADLEDESDLGDETGAKGDEEAGAESQRDDDADSADDAEDADGGSVSPAERSDGPGLLARPPGQESAATERALSAPGSDSGDERSESLRDSAWSVWPGRRSEVMGNLTLFAPVFSEDRGLSEAEAKDPPDEWQFHFHGYIRAPVRFHRAPKRARPPYLVDDNYFQSAFAYTRVNETEYGELFLGATHGRTRFVAGLLATQFSDWSETTLQGQGGLATAFVEHDLTIVKDFVDAGVRAGMFWERFGYVAPYDTYLLGRAHMAGARLSLRVLDVWDTKLGFGAHSDVISSNQGFTPVFFAKSGVDFGFVEGALFFGLTWTGDSEREFSIVEDGSLRVIGGEGRLAIPYVGAIHGIGAFYRARRVQFLANAYEILHSTGGRGLTQNFFGPDSDAGTGEALVFGFDFDWQVARSVEAIAGHEVAAYFRGVDVQLFGMLAWLASNQASENPLENFDQRVYIKWGIEPRYRPHIEGWDALFASLRFDRVILDKDHSSMAFRVVTPKVGATLVRDPDLDLFVSYSRYSYGENVKLRPNQIPGDLSVTKPDKDVVKIQAQVTW